LRLLTAIISAAVLALAFGAPKPLNQRPSNPQAQVSPSSGNAYSITVQDPSNSTSQCRSSDPEIRQLQQWAESSPLYRELANRFGGPKTCASRRDDLETDISYQFGENARLDILTNPTIELSEQHLHLRDITTESAIKLLKSAELYSYPSRGCGIGWNHPSTNSPAPDQSQAGSKGGNAASREVTYRGNLCNCEASIIYEHNSVAELALRSAC
jgi:hypothetical protein